MGNLNLKGKLHIVISCFLIVITINTICSITHQRDFDLTFKIKEEQFDNRSLNAAENVQLKGTLIRFPFNIYYIRGSMAIGENSFKILKYKKGSRIHLEAKKIDQYFFNVEMPIKEGSAFNSLTGKIDGDATIMGDIFDGSVESIHLRICENLEATKCYTINGYLVK